MKKINWFFCVKWIIPFVLVFVAQSAWAVMPVGEDLQSEAQPTLMQTKNYKPDEILVKFKKGVATANAESAANSIGALKAGKLISLKKNGLSKGKRKTPSQRWWLVKLPEGTTPEQAINALSHNPNVELAEPNYEVTIQLTPNDPRFPDLWGMENIQQTGGLYDADVDAPEAWDINTGSQQLIVAVIDTGIDYSHEDIADNMWVNSGETPDNGIDDDGNGFIDDVYGYDFVNMDGDPADDHGHGTHCAGTIAAVGDNSIGVVGVNWNSRVMAVKFLGSGGSGSTAGAINAIDYAVSMGANVLSNSWGGGGFSQALLDAINDASNAGVLFVAAAGNASNNNDSYPTYPATYDAPNVIAVAATDHNDNRASFSSYGATTVDLGAPGVSVLSSVPTESCSLCSSTGYRYLNGTSMATPHVSGAAALLWSHSPSLTMEEVKTVLMDTVDPIPALAGITVTGGRLNVNNALLLNLDYSVSVSPMTQTIIFGESTTYTITVTSRNDFSGSVTLSADSPDPGITTTITNIEVTPPANGSVSTTLTVSTASDLSRGSYFINVQATDDNGSTRAVEATLEVLVPEFEPAITPSSQSVGPGGNAVYTLTLTSLDGYTGTVNLSSQSPDSGISINFQPASLTVPVEGPVTSTMTITVDTDTPLQDYTLTAELSDGQIIKTVDVLLQVVDVDLQVTEVSTATPQIAINSSFVINNTVINTGSMPTSSAFSVAFYLSTDTDITMGDILLDSRIISVLGAGQSSAEATAVTVPANLAPGNYYLGAIVDYTGQEPESNESNNALTGTPVELYHDIDLVPTLVAASVSTIGIGEQMTVSNTIANQGASTASGAFHNRIYLSTDALITTADRYIAFRTIYNLGAGEESAIDTVVTLPVNLDPGTYYVGVIADYTDAQSETNETNNALVSAATIEVISNIDLVPSSVIPSASTINVGEQMTVSNAIVNQGITASGNFSSRIYLSTDVVITTADQYLTYRTISSLGAGEESVADTVVTLPVNLDPGSYYVGVIVDYYEHQPESDETNNALASAATIEVVRDVDLVPTAVVPSASTIDAGEQMTVSNTIVNQGTTVSGGVYSAIYLSTDAVITTADQYLARRTISNLEAGAESVADTVVTIPANLDPGTYYVGVIVDYPNHQPENDETNNALASAAAIEVISDVDLVLTSVIPSASTIDVGGQMTVSNTIANQGTTVSGRVYNGIYLSTDAVISTDDRLVVSRSINSLEAGAESAADTVVTIPASLDPGIYYLGMIADYPNHQPENNETNNVLVLAATIEVIRNVDLVPTLVAASVSTINIGEQMTMSNTVANRGTSTTSNYSRNGIYLSTDAVITTADRRIAYRGIYNVGPDAESAADTVVTIPRDLDPGTYYVGVIADYAEVQPETDETNNTLASAVTIEVTRDVDLVPTAVVPSVSTIDAGEQMTVSNTIANQGATITSRSFSVTIYLSTDAVITTADRYVSNYSISSLGAGTESTIDRLITIPADLDPGTYYVGVIADSSNYQPESDETNNALASAATIEVARDVDLVPTVVVASVSTINISEQMTVSNTVVNQGTTVSGTVYNRIYLSTDAVITTADRYVNGGRTIYGLGAGEESAVDTVVAIPANLDPGTYYVGVIVDSDDLQPESDETNNALASATTIEVARDVDLVSTEVVPSASTINIGEQITVSNTVANQGTTATSDSFYSGIYLSTDAVITTADRQVANRYIYGLGAGAESAVDTVATIPRNLAPGIYYVGVIADYSDRQLESDETNNTLISAATIEVLRDVDLVPTAVIPSVSTINAGEQVTVSNTIANQGTTITSRSFYSGIYLSADAVITTADRRVAYRSISNLGAGAESAADTAVTIPTNLDPGTYYVGVIADYYDYQPESDETNNTLASVATIEVVRDIDLVPTAVAPSVSTINAGEQITVSSTIVNQGTTITSGYFFSGIYLSTDAVISTADQVIDNRVIYNLGAGEESAADRLITIPANLDPGTYYVGIIADSSDVQPESDETNNALASAATIEVISDVDLVPTAVVPSASTINTGEQMTVSNTVANQGTTTPGYFYSRIYLSTDAVITTADRYVTQRGISNLVAGTESAADTVATIPGDLDPGIYYVGIIADYADVQPESDETNNTLISTATIEVIRDVDLVPTAVASSVSTINIGGQMTVSDTIANQGMSITSGNFISSIYLSTDAVITTADRFVTNRLIYSLRAGAESTADKVVTIPTSLDPGTYYVGVIADYTDRQPESDETNNALASAATIEVVRDIDLVPTSVVLSASTINTGEQMTVSSTIANQGTTITTSSTFYNAIYLSTDAVITTADRYLSNRSIYNLGAGEESAGDKVVTIPSNLAPGTYYVGVIADYNDRQPENDETNNAFVSAATIEVVSP